MYEFKQAVKAGEVEDHGDKGFEQFLEQRRAELEALKSKRKTGRPKNA